LLLLPFLATLTFWTISRNTDWQQPQTFWQQEQQRGGGPARSINNQAAALIDSGEFEKAVKLLENSLQYSETYEDHRVLLYNLGSALFHLGRYPESFKAFSQITKKYGSYKDTYLLVGENYLKMGQNEAAKQLVAKLLDHPGTSYLGKILQSEIYRTEGDYEKSENILKAEIAEVSPADLGTYVQLKLELARLYMAQKKDRQAYMIFIEVTETYPQHYPAWKMLYLMLESGGDKEGALAIKKFLDANNVKL
jgi:tetratricopeptide (TPR) repeat protein